MDLPRGWYSAGSNVELWGRGDTYLEVPFEHLPPIDRRRHDGSFRWLAEAPSCYGLQYGVDDADLPEDECRDRLRAIIAVARGEGFTVPASFVTLLSDPELFGRIPTCTACYVELPDRLITLDGHRGRFLRFMNDQQCVFVWGLLLLPDGGHVVVSAVPELRDDAEGETLEEVADFVDPRVCADDFEEFVHRFWLENGLWYATQSSRPLTPEEAAYVRHAKEHREVAQT